MWWIIAILLIILLFWWWTARESYNGYPGDWSLGGYMIGPHARTRIIKAPIYGGIVVPQIFPALPPIYYTDEEGRITGHTYGQYANLGHTPQMEMIRKKAQLKSSLTKQPHLLGSL